MPLNLLKAKGC